ncbi:flagellar hook-associated protein FlgK [uncultured Rheinheimera sp.]|jgi:flagellar hook-associated protein 1 FlgK|uniref:flagellar hook-associated protein FlgK n=1 Tax=uncultured Rheinheimera sp. TaxID=400532 RepID=UPI00259859BA|nr:flagellar hook-associated protein FlgK [uncultured Rheinheimera sp.]
MSMLSNGVSGLNAANAGLNAVSQNVSNAAVKGYSRQTVVLQTNDGPLNGVKVTKFERVVDNFLNADIWRTQSDLNYYESYQDYLGYLEEVLGTDSLNLNDAVAELNAAFNAALSAPESPAYRQQVISSANAMVQDLQQLDGALTGQVRKLEFELKAVTENVNSVLQELADLNQNISKEIALGRDASTLLDTREQAINRLSAYVQVEVMQEDNGSMTISALNGAPLVMSGKAAVLSVAGTEVTSTFNTQEFPISGLAGGSLGGLLRVKSEVLDPARAELSNLVTTIATQVNDALAEGFDLNGNLGEPLFTFNPADPLGSILVNADLSPDELAFRGRVSDGAGGWLPAGGKGDNSNLVNVIDSMKGVATGYDGLIGKLAIQSKQVQASVKTSQVLNDKAVASRESISGVNRDEEAANLLYYQQLYEANAKVISTAGQMFDTLMMMF